MTVVEAEDGRTALAAAAAGIDLAILDYRLPDIDGIDGPQAAQADRIPTSW